jgi:hypothetical protein
MMKLVTAAIWSNFSDQMPPSMPSSASISEAEKAWKSTKKGCWIEKSTKTDMPISVAVPTISPRVVPPMEKPTVSSAGDSGGISTSTILP